jgi:MFS family permease
VVLGFLSSALFLVPVFLTRDLTIITASLAGAFFCAEIVIGPMWAIPMDIAPQYSGVASGLMNVGSAFAAIVSPVVAGLVIDKTGNWTLPFIGSMILMVLGAVAAFWMRPEQPFDVKHAAR